MRATWMRRTATSPADEAAIAGAACTAADCERAAVVRCAYRDRRGRECTTTWCGQHRVEASGKPYCRRHAGVVGALASWEYVDGLPDVDSRAPALVSWTSNELDSRIRAVLRKVAPSGSPKLVTDPVHQVFTPGMAARRWVMSWKLVDHVSVLHRVSLEVDEGNDCVVRAVVNADLIGEAVPPWIERRRLGLDAPADVDAAQRKAFHDALFRSIELMITRQEVAPRRQTATRHLVAQA
ncbi:MAG: hypothetical protein E6J45_04315 [Chloroflexi bacterium]|nr:MAG: hypothetical protein E6J45_04315 [Chloroflexota bacterium]